jgi:molybdopterin/thiamine biosynthesis adenylyltransferase
MVEGRDRLTVDPEQIDGRYHRQELISWWEQARLAQARVVVVGAGALGNELVKNLVLLGVGQILVVDFDTIEHSNLSRCVFFRDADAGLFKAEVVARAARELNPDARVSGIVGDIRVDVGLAIFGAADLVLGGLDNREARLHINQSCWKMGTPFIDGAIEGLMGTVRVFVPPDSACYECTMNERDHQLIANRRSCALLTHEEMLSGKTPTTATTASVIAGIQVQEAVKILHGDQLQSSLAGRGFAYNGLTHDSYVVSYARRADCLSHDTYDPEQMEHQAPGQSLSTIMDTARDLLGSKVELELERELVTAFVCAACGTSEPVLAPTERLSVRSAQCPNCAEIRSPALTHRVRAGDEQLLRLTPADLGLPAFDVITARVEDQRIHFVVGDDGDPFEAVMRVG